MAPPPAAGPLRRRLLGQVREVRQLAEQAQLLSQSALRCSRALLQKRKGRRQADGRGGGGTKRFTDAVPLRSHVVSQEVLVQDHSTDPADTPAAGDSGQGLSFHSLSSDDFWDLAFRAGLRGNDVAWMENFEKLCAEGTDAAGQLGERVGANAFVRLIMDDLARHCQLTSNSLQGMLRVAQSSWQPLAGAQAVSSGCASEATTQGIAVEVAQQSGSGVTKEDSDWQPIALAQLPIRWVEEEDGAVKQILKVWPEEDATDDVNCGDSVDDVKQRFKVWPEKNRHKLADRADEEAIVSKDDLHEKRIAREKDILTEKPDGEPVTFDPIPETPLDVNARATDWSFALQGVFT